MQFLKPAAWLAGVGGVSVLSLTLSAQGNAYALDTGRVNRWLQQVEEHRAGAGDGAALSIATWTPAMLDGVVAHFNGLCGAAWVIQDQPQLGVVTYAGKRFTRAQLQKLLHLTDDELEHHDPNRIL